jgi:hypothetical protein
MFHACKQFCQHVYILFGTTASQASIDITKPTLMYLSLGVVNLRRAHCL